MWRLRRSRSSGCGATGRRVGRSDGRLRCRSFPCTGLGRRRVRWGLCCCGRRHGGGGPAARVFSAATGDNHQHGYRNYDKHGWKIPGNAVFPHISFSPLVFSDELSQACVFRSLYARRPGSGSEFCGAHTAPGRQRDFGPTASTPGPCCAPGASGRTARRQGR